MLVLTRAEGESIRIGEGVTVVVLEQRRRGRVRIGISAPPDVPIVRSELLDRPETPPSRRGGGDS